VDTWLLVLASACLSAWLLLALSGSDVTLPTFCSPAALWELPLSVSVDLAVLFNAPAKLVTGSALMVAAMMLPLCVAPLRHVRERSFVSRRAPAMLLFVAGYALVWMVVALALQALALVALWAAPSLLVCLAGAAATSMLWQVSPAKQWCLNRCHRRPHLAAFGAAADRDVFAFGLTNGMACAAACWPLMLLPLFLMQAHVFGMIVVALFLFAERLDAPAPLVWRWRGPGKALRLAMAQARMRLAPMSGNREALP
jgi:predicted metal-binding membrane protein